MINSEISIKEVAREAGVSPSTVSKVVNGYKNFSIRPEIREKIMAIVSARGYSPNPMFKSLRAEKCSQISMLFQASSPFEVGAVVNQAVKCMDSLLHERGYSLNYTFIQRNSEYVRFLPPWKVEGIVLSDIYSREMLDPIVRLGVSFVVLNGKAWDCGPAVQIDEEVGMRQAITHLVELGHTRIAYANAREFMHHSVSERYDAYLKVLGEYGLEAVAGHDEMAANPADYLRRRVCGQATALVVYDHLLALQYLHAAWELGIRIPDQLSVIAFNDDTPAEIAIPPLTCIANPSEAMGQQAVEVLLRQIASGNLEKNVEIKIQGRLVIRQSTGRLHGLQ